MNRDDITRHARKIVKIARLEEEPGGASVLPGVEEQLRGIVLPLNEKIGGLEGSLENANLALKRAEKIIGSERAKVKALADKLQERAAVGAPPTDPPLWALDFVLRWWNIGDEEMADATLPTLVSDARSLAKLTKGGSDG